VADGSCFYLFVDTGDFTGPAYSLGFMFGDFFSHKSGDLYNCAIIGRDGENNNTNTYELLPRLAGPGSALGQGGLQNMFIARHWTGVGGSIQFNKFSSILNTVPTGSSTMRLLMGGNNGSPLPYPNGPDGALELAPVFIGHSNAIRGYMKGFWNPCHFQPLNHGDTFSGTGNMSGKSFLALNMQAAIDYMSSTNGQIVAETSDTWS
jgi:hypothetical protein